MLNPFAVFLGQLPMYRNSKFQTKPISEDFSYPQEEISVETNLKEISTSLSQDETCFQKLDDILQETSKCSMDFVAS